jgi:hypothetical protein
MKCKDTLNSTPFLFGSLTNFVEKSRFRKPLRFPKSMPQSRPPPSEIVEVATRKSGQSMQIAPIFF